jgi:hypothetical protein
MASALLILLTWLWIHRSPYARSLLQECTG